MNEQDIFLNSILDTIQSIIYIFDLEAQTIIYANDKVENILGYTLADLQALGNEFVSTIVHKDDQKIVMSLFQKISLVSEKELFKNEYRLKCKNGDYKWFECQATIYKFDNQNKPIQLLGNAQDITDRKNKEFALLEKESHILNIANNLPVIISYVDKTLTYQFVNLTYENWFYLKRENIIGRKAYEILNKTAFDRAFPYMQRALNGEAVQFENIILNFEKSERFVQTSYIPRYDFENKISGFYVLGIDITEQKMNEVQLLMAKESAEKSDLLKTQFLRNMSHEIRTPLNGIKGFSDLLIKNANSSKAQLYKRHIDNCSEQLLNIIENIVEFSKIQSGDIQISDIETDVQFLFNQLYDEFADKLEGKSLVLKQKNLLQANESLIITDKYKIIKILYCLIDNAIKFTHEGSIEYGCNISSTDKNLLEFHVSDSGIGIVKEQQQNIFIPFRQVEMGLSRNYGGNGLGLSIAKSYIEKLGGSISLSSEENEGTTFLFTIPYKLANNSEAVRPKSNEVIYDLSGKTILIAEDEESNYLYLNELLEIFNSNIVYAKNGQIAVDLCRNNSTIDLILMDIKMPVMDGFTATKIIKSFRPEIRIIAQTAFANENDKIEFLENGFDDFISKPIEGEVLYKVIARNLDK